MKTDWRNNICRGSMSYIRQGHMLVFLAIFTGMGLGAAFGSKSLVSSNLLAWLNTDTVITASAAAKEDSDAAYGSELAMVVNYGYDQYVKYGRYMNVSAAITNNGGDFAGWLQVIVPKAENKNNVVYRREVRIASENTEEVSITLPVMDDTGSMQVKLVDDDGNTVVEKIFELKIGNYEKLAYIGILSDEKEKLDYIQNYGTRVFYLDENTLSDDYLGLDLLDAIIINRFDTGRISDRQLEAIEKWVMNGGTLVLGTGEYADETLSKFGEAYSIEAKGSKAADNFTFGMNRESLKELKQDILDYEEERRIFLEAVKDRNEMLIAYGNEPVEIDNSVFEKWTKDKINQLQLENINKKIAEVEMEGSSTIVSEGGFKLMQTGPAGLGKVQLFSFDLGLNEETQTIGLAVLNEIRKNMSNKKLTQLEEEYYGSYLNYGIYNSMFYTDAKNVPVTGKYIIILVIYICMAGPVTYLILRKLEKRNLTWVVVPVMAVVFTLLVYYTGSDTRIKNPYVGYVKLLIFQKDNKVNEELYFSLTAPYNHNYSVSVGKDYDISELRGQGNNNYLYDYGRQKEIYYDNYITSIDYGIRDTELTVRDNPAFSPVYYQSADSYDMANQLTCDIHYAGDRIYGTVTNGFGFDITNAMLTSDGYVINIGEIGKGETVSLDGKDAIFLTTRDELYNMDMINRIAGGTGDVKDNTAIINRLSNVLYYLTENNLLNDQHSSCIIGFVSESESKEDNPGGNNLLDELTKNMDAFGTTAVKLPVEVDYRSGDRILVPDLDPYVIISEGFYEKYYQSRYLSSDSMTMEYHFPEEDNIISFEYLTGRNQDSSNDYLSAFDGKIYFLNRRTGKYDEVFKEGAGSSVTDTADYLTEKNTITIRYSTDMSLKGYQMLLPYISYWKEADSNAGN